jgi:hypothetical protein
MNRSKLLVVIFLAYSAYSFAQRSSCGYCYSLNGQWACAPSKTKLSLTCYAGVGYCRETTPYCNAGLPSLSASCTAAPVTSAAILKGSATWLADKTLAGAIGSNSPSFGRFVAIMQDMAVAAPLGEVIHGHLLNNAKPPQPVSFTATYSGTGWTIRADKPAFVEESNLPDAIELSNTDWTLLRNGVVVTQGLVVQ